MEAVVGGTGEIINVPLGMEEREKLLAWVTNILKEETDVEILRSVFELLRDLRTNVGVREGLKSFRKNGWALIRKTQEGNDGFELPAVPTSSSSMMIELKQAQLKRNLESRLDHEAHPLSNDLILKKIFEFSSVKDLKNCRLVSKKWCDLSLTSWRRKAVLLSDELFEEHCGDDEDAATQAFVKNASNFLEVPFQRYNMHFFDRSRKKMVLDFFSSSIHELRIFCDDLELMALLFTKLPELRVLHLRLNCCDLNSEYRSIISKGGECPFRELEQASSKLRKLELDLCSSWNHEINAYFPWKKIFRNVPSLKSLGFNSSAGVNKFIKEQILESVCEVRKEGIEGNLSILDLEELIAYRLDHHVVSRIVESRFPLRSLWIHVGNETSYDPAMLDLLEAHTETLEYIKCGFWRDQDYRRLLIKPYFPSKLKLPNLKKLVLETGIAFTNLLCSLTVPNLEDLMIEPNSFIRKECLKQHSGRTLLNAKTFRDSCIYPNLNKFFFDEPWNFSAKELRVLAKSMPNVIDLGIPLDEATFPIVYEIWPGLQSLHLFATSTTCPLLDDYAVTGIPVADDDIRVESRGPNITNLKNLRKFVLETRIDSYRNLLRPRRAWITDLSAVHGFLQLPILEILDIETVCKFSPSVMVALKDHVWEIKIREPDIFRYARADVESDSESDGESSSDGSHESSSCDFD